eukprot:9134535-Pyramimonas_sp.AAC.1
MIELGSVQKPKSTGQQKAFHACPHACRHAWKLAGSSPRYVYRRRWARAPPNPSPASYLKPSAPQEAIREFGS